MILYPTETIYGLGVNALDDGALARLFELKGRDESQTVSWLVRDLDDIRKYAEVSKTAAKIAEQFLPGPLTFVLPANENVPESRRAPDKTVGFRISPDPVTQQLIADFMEKHDAPLTCTSANVSGMTPQSTPEEIIKQFGHLSCMIDKVIDDGPRSGEPSTVIRVIEDKVEILREGAISESDILKLLK